MTGDMMELTGGCLCGAVRYRARGKLLGVNNCYCGMCRRNSGAGFMTFVGFAKADVAFTGEPPTPYRSSEQGARCFCRHCGSPVSYLYTETAEIWLTAGSLDEPDAVSPTENSYLEDKVRWVHADESLQETEDEP